ncbi:hypothetical protein DHW03_06715 [Pedobacter yonginense]|uniref:Aerotolerance regulator N-terminal domain-containing protein n=1 Tax=Pedobacter yonginense TaxID=651869 RepID=A0A317EWA1_9SPHI|nr:hypothetical protein [Pedobacter yonginense]PWS29496.1 hypothetical protein DHW03_06715 [Pedobacter yonginense]
MEFKLIITLLSLAFAAFLVFKEIRRADKARLTWRLISSVLMVASFALLILPITYSVKKEEPAYEMNLLTPGVSIDSVSAIKGPKFDLDSSLFPSKRNLKINHIPDLAYFLKAHPEIKKVNVYGDGLEDAQLQALSNYQRSFHPSANPTGVIAANWPKKLNASEDLTVQGAYNNQTNQSVWLKLRGLGANLDSVEVMPNAKINFSLQTKPKQSGKAVYQLISLQKSDTLSADPIPFEVVKKQAIRVLILASFPDFEYKFIKKWLFENGYPVAFRSQISKNKFSTDFLNTKATNLNQINQSMLKNIDVVVIDDQELTSISSSDKAAIYGAVNNGMGLIVRVTNAKADGTKQSFGSYEVLPSTEKPAGLKSTDGFKFNSLPFTQTLFLKLAGNHQPIITDEPGKVVVNSQISGMGKILTSSISSTYQWQLGGKPADYGEFWSMLFAKSSRKKIENQSIEIQPQFPSVNEKLRIIVDLANQKLPKLTIDGTDISPRQNIELPFEWDGFYWPKRSGWANATINQESSSIYIYQKSDWLSVKSMLKQSKNFNFIKNQERKNWKSSKIEYSAEEEISKWWFLLLFLATSAFLWYELRVLANK